MPYSFEPLRGRKVEGKFPRLDSWFEKTSSFKTQSGLRFDKTSSFQTKRGLRRLVPLRQKRGLRILVPLKQNMV